ncbi:MAG: glycosyltransferase [Bacteroidota bacterium]
MLSILLPIYNFDVRQLVRDLERQCREAQMPYEILCYDDRSGEKYRRLNRQIGDLPGVSYQELPENVGRSSIRNLLGRAARHDYLLFIDCDSQVVRPDYLQKYQQAARPDTILCGGRVYSRIPPQSLDHYFHWYYGRRREQKLASERAQTPYNAFLTHHFVIPKALFLDIQFEESLREYGHEDTLFGLELKKRGHRIVHLDNPLEHIGLEKTPVFLAKSRQALDNLGLITRQNLGIETRLLDAYQRLKRWGLSRTVGLLGKWSERVMLQNFHSSRPNLHVFDWYKLAYFIQVMEGEQEK